MVTVPSRIRLRLLAALLLAAAPAPVRSEETTPAPPLVVRQWLALDPVDERARVPFGADAVFLRHLLDRDAAPPKAGETVKGDRGEAPWRVVAAKEDGTVDDENGAWFYGEIEGPKGPAGPLRPVETVYLAPLDGATNLFVNGAGFPGDVYRVKTGPVAVALRAGTNRLFVSGPRGPWRLRFEPWPAGRSPILREDATLPDVVGGEPAGSASASFRILNPTTEWRTVGAVPAAAPPLWTGKETRTVALARDPKAPFPLEVRKPGEARRITFVSRIDGSVQFYGCLPPAKGELPPEEIGLVLSLHGAGVDALEQARAYSPKPDFRIVAPTNRRPYGFDWQDWGREDAYEALADAHGKFRFDGARVCLTGHSMGGHGTWHLAANDPESWLAIAPSAGWCSFDTYPSPRPTTPLSSIWRACDGGSRTEDLVANLVAIPTFVLHGTKDGTVPLSEAEGMLKRLEAAGGKPLHHFQEGADHWWDGNAAPGADCVDWPGIFDLFRKAKPRYRMREEVVFSFDGPIGPTSFDWTSASPSQDPGHFWVHAVQPLEYGRPIRIRARWTGSGVEATTENARHVVILCPVEGPLLRCTLDGQAFPVAEDTAVAAFRRDGARWTALGEDRRTELHLDLPEGEKRSHSGPFKRAFGNRFVLVVGTKGTDAENRESMELARFHASTWWYRANGNAPVVRDVDLLDHAQDYRGRNLVLYGNADVNAAWKTVVPASCPLKATRGSLTLGTKEWKGDGLGAVLVHPRADDPTALVGAFASTGARGTRVGYGLRPFASGVGYPDYAVFGAEILRSGDGGVLAAGWFDQRWALQAGGFLREENK